MCRWTGRDCRSTGWRQTQQRWLMCRDTLVAIARDWGADLLHLNLPSQAAGFPDGMPVVVTSHSCLATWWRR